MYLEAKFDHTILYFYIPNGNFYQNISFCDHYTYSIFGTMGQKYHQEGQKPLKGPKGPPVETKGPL